MKYILSLTVVLFFSYSNAKTIKWREVKESSDLNNVDAIEFFENCKREEIPFSNPEFKFSPQGTPRRWSTMVPMIQDYSGQIGDRTYMWKIRLKKGESPTNEMAQNISKFLRVNKGSGCSKRVVKRINPISHDCSSNGHNSNP